MEYPIRQLEQLRWRCCSRKIDHFARVCESPKQHIDGAGPEMCPAADNHGPLPQAEAPNHVKRLIKIGTIYHVTGCGHMDFHQSSQGAHIRAKT